MLQARIWQWTNGEARHLVTWLTALPASSLMAAKSGRGVGAKTGSRVGMAAAVPVRVPVFATVVTWSLSVPMRGRLPEAGLNTISGAVYRKYNRLATWP